MAYPIQSNLPIGGIATVSINGVPFLAGEDMSWKPTVPERPVVKGRGGVYGYDEKPSEGFIKVSAYDYNGNSVTSIGNQTNATVIWSARNGKVVTATGAWSSEPPEVDATGKFTCTFLSADVREI